MTLYLIINPKAKDGRSRKLTSHIFSRLNALEVSYQYKIIDDIEEATQHAFWANKEGYDIIVAVGGDGTIRAVLNGFFDDEGRRLSSAAMGVIYTGTSPDFCKSYNIPTQIDEAIDTLLKNHTKEITVGRISFSKVNDPRLSHISLANSTTSKTEYFGCCANIGLGAKVARKANSGIRKYLGDFPGTLISLIVSIAKYTPSNQFVELNNMSHSISRLYNLSVGKTQYIASGIKVFHKLDPDSKQLYCITARDFTLFSLPGILRKAYSGKEFKNSDKFKIEYTDEIKISGNAINPEIELDGDPAGYLPCQIDIARDCLTLVIKETNEDEKSV